MLFHILDILRQPFLNDHIHPAAATAVRTYRRHELPFFHSALLHSRVFRSPFPSPITDQYFTDALRLFDERDSPLFTALFQKGM
jgi:hypothetical protein